MTGALTGVRMLEIAGIGPVPFCGMMLADHGAEVIRIERPNGWRLPGDPLERSRRSLTLDLKQPEAIAVVRDLAKSCDGLIEGYRPGVMERLGLGPALLLGDHPGLVYGRMTGWGQNGPLAGAAGHDINYIALSGVLHGIGRDGRPSPPVNYLGDFGGGGMLLAFAMVSALLAVKNGAPGQVIDCAMTEGSALLSSLVHGLRAAGQWRDEAGRNLLDSGNPWYDAYETADGKWIAIGALEPQFRAELAGLLGVEPDDPEARGTLSALFLTRTRDEWCARLEGTDACFAPILSLAEAPGHDQAIARGSFVTVGGVVQPAPAPRFSMTPSASPIPPKAEADALLGELGYAPSRIAELRKLGILL